MRFPGFLIRRMRLRLFPRPKADNRNAVAAHNGDAVGGEGPLIHHRRFAEQTFIGVAQGANGEVVLFHFPGREVAFGRVDQAGPGGALVVVHRDHRGGFFHRRQRADLFQRAFPGFAPGQTAVNGDGAAIRYRAAARRGEENLGNGQGAFAEEFVIAQLV